MIIDPVEIRRQRNQLQLVQFLAGLSSSFVGVVDQIIASDSLPSLDNVFKHIQRIPSTTHSASSIVDSTDVDALVVISGGRGHVRGRGRSFGGNCWGHGQSVGSRHCKFYGHNNQAEDCC